MGKDKTFKASHFENIQELINTCKVWIRDDDYDAYCRFFDMGAMEELLNELEKKDKIIDELKNHIHYKICPNCNKEFKAKRSDAIFCPQCRSKMNNKYYFKNLTEEQKDIRRQKVRESMRRYRAKKKEGKK